MSRLFLFTQSVFIVEKTFSNICGNFTFIVHRVGLRCHKGFEWQLAQHVGWFFHKIILRQPIHRSGWPTLQRKSYLRTQKRNWASSQFPHSCVCERFIFPGSIHIFSCSRIGRKYKSVLCLCSAYIQWDYSQADPIWPDGPFKNYEQSVSCHVVHLTSSLMSPLLSLDLSFSFSSLSWAPQANIIR